jgi:hypothetical protein
MFQIESDKTKKSKKILGGKQKFVKLIRVTFQIKLDNTNNVLQILESMRK